MTNDDIGREHDGDAPRPPEETDDTGAPERFADASAAVNPDLTAAPDAEDLDEDRLGADPLESAMDPPEGWSASDRHGVTAREQAQGETLEEHLAAERPDVGDEPDQPGQRPIDRRARRAPDAQPSADDAPTARTRIEHRDDPGGEYR